MWKTSFSALKKIKERAVTLIPSENIICLLSNVSPASPRITKLHITVDVVHGSVFPLSKKDWLAEFYGKISTSKISLLLIKSVLIYITIKMSRISSILPTTLTAAFIEGFFCFFPFQVLSYNREEGLCFILHFTEMKLLASTAEPKKKKNGLKDGCFQLTLGQGMTDILVGVLTGFALLGQTTGPW